MITRDSIFWGKGLENGVWISPKSRWRLLWADHDSLFVAAGRFRLRLMKPARKVADQ